MAAAEYLFRQARIAWSDGAVQVSKPGIAATFRTVRLAVRTGFGRGAGDLAPAGFDGAFPAAVAGGSDGAFPACFAGCWSAAVDGAFPACFAGCAAGASGWIVSAAGLGRTAPDCAVADGSGCTAPGCTDGDCTGGDCTGAEGAASGADSPCTATGGAAAAWCSATGAPVAAVSPRQRGPRLAAAARAAAGLRWRDADRGRLA